MDPNIARAAAREAGVGPGDRVIEIGAGLGSLTVALADTGAEVLAVEFDRALLPALGEVVDGDPRIHVLHADAMRLDWEAALGAEPGPWVLCANLPYNIATPVVLDVLHSVQRVRSLLVMVQREVGERLVATEGTDAYGAISVHVAYHARASILRRVPPTVFWPKPTVGSVLLRLERLPEPVVATDETALLRVVDEAFAQRRKTMRNALRRLGLDAAHAAAVLVACGVDPSARPEQLGLETFALIAEALAA